MATSMGGSAGAGIASVGIGAVGTRGIAKVVGGAGVVLDAVGGAAKGGRLTLTGGRVTGAAAGSEGGSTEALVVAVGSGAELGKAACGALLAGAGVGRGRAAPFSGNISCVTLTASCVPLGAFSIICIICGGTEAVCICEFGNAVSKMALIRADTWELDC